MCHYSEHEIWIRILKSNGKCFDGTVSQSTAVCPLHFRYSEHTTQASSLCVSHHFYWCACRYTVDEEHGAFESLLPVLSNLMASHLYGKLCQTFEFIYLKIVSSFHVYNIVSCSELSFSYDYSMNNFCDLTIIRYLK